MFMFPDISSAHLGLSKVVVLAVNIFTQTHLMDVTSMMEAGKATNISGIIYKKS